MTFDYATEFRDIARMDACGRSEREVEARAEACETLARRAPTLESLERAIASDDRDFAWAFASSNASIRKMACVVVKEVVKKGRDEASAKARFEARRAALTRIARGDTTTIANAAIEALIAMCERDSTVVDGVLEGVVRELMRDGTTTARARGAALAAAVSGANEESALAVVRSGALEGLVREIENHKEDGLGSLVALEIVADVAETSTAAASGLKALGVGDALARIANDPDTDSAVRAQTLKVSGRVAGTSSSADDALVQKMRDMLVDMFEMGERDIRASVFDALGAMCAKSKPLASDIVPSVAKVVDSIAYSAFKGSGELQLFALYALGSICGAERGGDALLSAAAEGVIKSACFSACEGQIAMEDRVHSVVAIKATHFDELRCQMFRLLSALCKRDWCAEAVANHAALRQDLCHEFERNSYARDFRAAALKSLAAANISNTLARDEFALAAAGRLISRAATVAIPVVATAHRS